MQSDFFVKKEALKKMCASSLGHFFHFLNLNKFKNNLEVDHGLELIISLPKQSILTNSEINREPKKVYNEMKAKQSFQKIDNYIVPFLGNLYAFAMLDRLNLGFAIDAGLEKDLNIEHKYFSTLLSSFFYLYSFASVFSLFIFSCGIVRPANWLCTLAVTWGTVTICTGFVKSFTGLLILRLFLGLSQAGIFGCILEYICRWFTPAERAQRVGMVFGTTVFLGAFSGLIAFGISLLDGTHGKKGWGWIYIIEGILTIIMGTIIKIFVPNANSLREQNRLHFISNEHIAILNTIYYEEEPDNTENSLNEKIYEFFSVLKQYQTWIFITCGIFVSAPFYSFIFYIKPISKGLNYSDRYILLFCLPPGFIGALSSGFIGYLISKNQRKCNLSRETVNESLDIITYLKDKHLNQLDCGNDCLTNYLEFNTVVNTGNAKIFDKFIALAIINIIGFFLSILTENNTVKYLLICLLAGTTAPEVVLLFSWICCNVHTPVSRGAIIGIVSGFGSSLGAIFSSYAYSHQKFNKRFFFGHGMNILFQFFLIGSIYLLKHYFLRQNKKYDNKLNGSFSLSCSGSSTINMNTDITLLRKKRYFY